MGLLIPSALALWNPQAIRDAEERERIAFAQDDYITRKTRQSERGENPVETIDGDKELLATSMNWDYSPGWEDRRIAHVKKLKAQRKPFKPSVRIRRPNGQIENVYEGDMVDLAWFERGECCVRCSNWKHEDPFQHAREHRLLQEKTGAQPPAGVPLKDLCSTCGNRLDTQKFREKAA